MLFLCLFLSAIFQCNYDLFYECVFGIMLKAYVPGLSLTYMLGGKCMEVTHQLIQKLPHLWHSLDYREV